MNDYLNTILFKIELSETKYSYIPFPTLLLYYFWKLRDKYYSKV